MKSLFTGLVATAVIAMTGCSQGTPGGPGVTKVTANKPVYGEADDTFNLRLPPMSTSMKQGDTKTVSISIARGKNFDQDVTLKLADVPKGVTLDPSSPVIKRGDTETKLTLKVAADASLGDFTLKVTGQPAKSGAESTNEFKITVAKK